MTLRVLDLFSGIGGFSLGLHMAGGFETVAFCEIDPYCRAVLRKHWPDVPIFEDVRELGRSDVGTVDVICGGFPCQDLSVAGKGAGLDGERSGLWREIARLTSELRPRYVIVENVSALLCRGMGRVLGDLAEVGYDAEWHCIPASYVGAPHRRDRVWIVAHPKQKQRFCPVLYGDNAPKRAWPWSHEERDKDGVRFEMGAARSSVPGRWLDQPNPERVAHGVPYWPYRLGALGNAVVPQVVAEIGRAIVAAERVKA